MPIGNNCKAALWLMVTSAVCAAQVGIAQVSLADPAWRTKPPSQWTDDDARQLLIRSPWAVEIGAGIARRQTEDQLREGGRMGQPTGVGYDGVDPKGSGPKVDLNVFTGAGGNDRSARSLARGMRVRLRWESALPVRLAELKAKESEPPVLEGEGYQIAVYGLPGDNFKGDPIQLGEPLKKEAALKRESKKDVRPIRVEVFPRPDGVAVVYVFPLSAEIIGKDGQVRFEAHIGRITVEHTFELKDMEFLGKLEL